MSEAPALGFSIVSNLGDNRQITTQCFVGVDEPIRDIHARIDLVQAVIDRQQAKYQIKDLTAELEKHKVTYQRLHDDLNDAELRFKQGQDASGNRLVEIGQLLASGMMPAGNRKALETEKSALILKREGEEAERKAHLSNVLTSKDRFEEEIDRLERKISDAKALIEG